MEIAPKALYNSLRMSFLQSPTRDHESWKVEDYRKLSSEELFERLALQEIVLDKPSFIAYCDEHDSPEELFETIMHESEECDGESVGEKRDQIYLLLFELWRRLVPEKQSISIICDELDYQIFLYDSSADRSEESLVDAISSLYTAIEENIDRGLAAPDVYAAICEYLANDFQTFLIDYLSDLVERGEYLYAGELLEQFYTIMPDKKWFDLINCRLIAASDIHRGHKALAKVYEAYLDAPDLQFNLDILSYLVNLPDIDLFCHVAQASIELIESEEDLQEFISISSEFYRNFGNIEAASMLSNLLEKREHDAKVEQIQQSDPDLLAIRDLLKH